MDETRHTSTFMDQHRDATQNLRSLAPALVDKAKQLEYEVATRQNAVTDASGGRGGGGAVTDADASGALRGAVEQIAALADKVEGLMEVQARQLEAADLQLRFLRSRVKSAENNADARAASAVRVVEGACHGGRGSPVPSSSLDTLRRKEGQPGVHDASDPEEIRKFLDRELFDFTKLEGVGTSSQAGTLVHKHRYQFRHHVKHPRAIHFFRGSAPLCEFPHVLKGMFRPLSCFISQPRAMRSRGQVRASALHKMVLRRDRSRGHRSHPLRCSRCSRPRGHQRGRLLHRQTR